MSTTTTTSSSSSSSTQLPDAARLKANRVRELIKKDLYPRIVEQGKAMFAEKDDAKIQKPGFYVMAPTVRDAGVYAGRFFAGKFAGPQSARYSMIVSYLKEVNEQRGNTLHPYAMLLSMLECEVTLLSDEPGKLVQARYEICEDCKMLA